MISLAVYCVALLAQPSPVSGVSNYVCNGDYRGCAKTGHNGEVCANWLSVGYWGDEEFVRKDQAAQNGIGNHNYCRNPGSYRYGPWCYQENRNKVKIYCTVGLDTCFKRPENDSKCPRKQAKSGTVRPQRTPEIYMQYVNRGEKLTLVCKEECTGTVIWLSGPQLTSQRTYPTVTVDPVTEATVGDWKCLCDGREYIRRVDLCRFTWSECKQEGGRWIKEGTSHCSTDDIKTEPCTPPTTPEPEENTVDDNTNENKDSYEEADDDDVGNTTEDKDSGNAAARKDDTEEPTPGCTGSSCGFCNSYPVVCGILGFVITAIAVVAALFIRKSLKWRKEARIVRFNPTLETVLTGSQLTGSYVKRSGDPREPENVTSALQLEQLILQMTQQRSAGLSCSTSLTDTLHLRYLRQNDSLGRIKSKDVESSEDIHCQSYEDSSEDEFVSHFGSVMPNNDHLREDADPVFQAAPIDEYIPYPSEEAEPVGSEETGYRGHGEGYRDATLFDRYYDQDVDRWSIEVEAQI